MSTAPARGRRRCGGRCRPWTTPFSVAAQHRVGQSLVPRLKKRRWGHRLAIPWKVPQQDGRGGTGTRRSEEHTSELQSLMRISYAVFCVKKKKQYKTDRVHDDSHI